MVMMLFEHSNKRGTRKLSSADLALQNTGAFKVCSSRYRHLLIALWAHSPLSSGLGAASIAAALIFSNTTHTAR